MLIRIPKEIKYQENQVGGTALGIGFTDLNYAGDGATIAPNAEAIFGNAQYPNLLEWVMARKGKAIVSLELDRINVEPAYRFARARL